MHQRRRQPPAGACRLCRPGPGLIARCQALLEGSTVAEPLLRRALSIQREVLVAGHRALVPTLTSLGETLLARNERNEASMVLNEAVQIAQHKLVPRHSARLQAEAAPRRLRKDISRTALRR